MHSQPSTPSAALPRTSAQLFAPLEVIARLSRGISALPQTSYCWPATSPWSNRRVASCVSDAKWKPRHLSRLHETGETPSLDALVWSEHVCVTTVDPTTTRRAQHGKTVHMALNDGASVRVWREHVPTSPQWISDQSEYRQISPAPAPGARRDLSRADNKSLSVFLRYVQSGTMTRTQRRD